MTLPPHISEFFTAGGTLGPDAPSYVHRPTDDELYQNIKAGEFCYVLTPRQMGKSSLMIRTARRLLEEGIKSAIVDLTQTGTVESEDQWYKGILSQIQRRLRLSVNPVQWWEAKKDIPNIQKFIEFFEEALAGSSEQVVIFMDEIDTTLKLDFRDNFFAGIRALYNARAENPDLKRITFVLLGVASPSDLIKDRSRTPFNIGHEIPLKPFNRQDARMLEQGLEAAYPAQGRRILDRVFYWTNGHPYLTQKICQSLVDEPLGQYKDGRVDDLVARLFISEQASGETNLQFVRESVLYSPDRRDNLSLYKKVLEGKEVPDNRNSVAQNHLKLAGLVRVDDGRLVVSNRIYARVFDLAWVQRYTEVRWSRVIAAVLAILVTVLLLVIYHDGVYLPGKSQADIDNLAIYKDDRGIHYLASLFQISPYLVPNEYEYKAKDVFFNTFSRQDQIDLIDIDEYKEKALTNHQEFTIVVAGLYTSLADVDRSGQTTELLEKMKKSLETLEERDTPLYQEIGYWLAARAAAGKGDLSGAVQNYSAAIGKNPKNPATYFERARIFVLQEDYEKALKDYDQVVAIVPKSNVEPTSVPTATSAGTAPGGSTAPSQAPALLTRIPTSSTLLTPVSVTPTSEANATQGTAGTTLPAAPTPTQILSPIQPRFLTSGQRVAAVNNDIQQNQSLIAFLLKANSSDYPNLEAKGFIQLARASVATAQISSTSTPGTQVLAATEAMVQIPAGNYQVGLDSSDQFHGAAMTVALSSFWIDRYLATNQQYQEFINATGAPAPEVWPGEKDHPVRGVTWEQASAYCAWTNKRLPTQAEWEAAGRGPGTSPALYPWGNDATAGGQVAGFSDADTYPIGTLSFNQTSAGVYDMVGNVWQWVSEPYGLDQGENRYLVGGRFGLPIADLAYRLEIAPGDTRFNKYAGFRCAASEAGELTGSNAATLQAPQTITPVANLVPGSSIAHTVVEGDWLAQIARCYGADLNAVQQANPNITDPQAALTVSNVVVPNIGSVGTIFGPPCVVFYIVANGDSWRSIAEQFNADITVLMEANAGITPIPGTRVKIPLNSGSTPVVLTFPPGDPSSISQAGTITTPGTIRYVISGTAGQTMDVALQVPTNDVNLAIYRSDLTSLKAPDTTTTWIGTLDETGNYFIELSSLAGIASKAYTLNVTLAMPSVSTQPTLAILTESPVIQRTATPIPVFKVPQVTNFPTNTPVPQIQPTVFRTNTPQTNNQSGGGSGTPPAIYVDTGYTGAEAGSQEHPYNTFAEAIAVAQAQPLGGYIFVKQNNGTWSFDSFVAPVNPPATGPG